MTDIDELRARPDRCDHGVRFPHPCDECHDEDMKPHNLVKICLAQSNEIDRLQAELAALRSAQQWQPLSQDQAECVLLDCLKAMKVPGDDKCLIDEMRARGVWVYQKPAPTTDSQPKDSSNED